MNETRATWRRTWIKLYPQQCINGSIRLLEPDERSVWYDLLAFSALCIEPGLISDNDRRPYPLKFIANRLNIEISLLEKAIKDFREEGRIKCNGTGIEIVNFKAYQSEYQRQKPYREAKKQDYYTCSKCQKQVLRSTQTLDAFEALAGSNCYLTPKCTGKLKRNQSDG
jgi:hypothetical protein